MRAALAELDREFDLLVIGGGIHGAFAAMHAARRGLGVALIERGDYAGGTSSNSLRIAHGGLRYLGRADVRRMRESIAERDALMRFAPHLVHPLPCALPLGGRLHRAPYAAVLAANDLVVRLLTGRDSTIPRGRTLGRAAMHALAEDAWWGGAGAAALWHDALITHPERLLLMVLRDAVDHGAVVRNYTEAVGLLRDAARVTGARAVDTALGPGGEAERGAEVEIRARVVLDAGAPGTLPLHPSSMAPSCAWADGWNVVLRGDRPLPGAAIAIPHPDERRFLFAVPWSGALVLGTGYAPRRIDATPTRTPRLPAHDELRSRAQQLVDAAQRARPGLQLREMQLALVHAGVLPMKPAGAVAAHSLLDQPLITDHARYGAPGLVSVTGVKWTTAGSVAGRAVDACERRIRDRVTRTAPPGATDTEGPAGGDAVAHHLHALYGRSAREVQRIAATEPALARPLHDGAPTLAAEVAHAVRAEGAVHLADVLMRRTGAAAAGFPGSALVREAARVMRRELAWNDERTQEEIADMHELFALSPTT